MNLSCFPTPYPGESLYSVLCRYHVRSCNKNDLYTIAQLFGGKTSVQYTVLSPALLAYETGWLGHLYGITMKSLMNENTAYRFSIPFESYFSTNLLTEENNTPEKSYFFRKVQRRYIHPSRQLRYCPKCAAEQRKMFGESYWNILPHLSGYEICHIHGEPIRESGIPLKATIYKFYPASNYIQDNCEIHENMENMQKIDRHLDSYERHAKEISWCYHNGHTIGSYARKICDYAEKNIPGMKIDFLEMFLDDMIEFPFHYYGILSSNIPDRWMWIEYLSHIQQIRMFEIISGTLPSEASTKTIT